MYKIKLPNFEGPFDLLLYFIKRDELNIYDIPISYITEEFLNYIRIMQYFDLELAGEFILMAANLMYIKTQLLLPVTKDDNEEEIEDPRTNLVQHLLEYKKYKEAAIELREMNEDQKYVLYRKIFDGDIEIVEENTKYKNATLFDLIGALRKAIDRNQKVEIKHEVEILNVTIEDRIEHIIKMISKKKRISFSDTIVGVSKLYIVVTFLAILDLLRNNKILVFQENSFDDFLIIEPQ
ncbi:MAG TPA: segregation/condensation protein A [Candidatus Kapabacteria bacterium]|nr:segregation/condensation protein A [Candidatus Kapabacteria bacterium]